MQNNKEQEAPDLLIVSDLHVNSTVSICPPCVTLDNGGTYRASRWQRALWEAWLDMIDQARARANGRELVAVVNGDLAELDAKKRSNQIISRNQADIKKMTLQVLEPLADAVSRFYIVRGTEAHEGKSAAFEEEIALDFDNVVHDEHTASHWHMRRFFGAYRFDIAHHTNASLSRWSKGNPANSLAARIIMDYRNQGIKEPHFVVRSHVHTVHDSGMNYKPLQAVTTPCWTGLTAHGHRVGLENIKLDIGALYFRDGGVEFLEYRLRQSEGWRAG